VSIGRLAVFRLPHGRLLSESCPAHAITSDTVDSISSWIGSYSMYRPRACHRRRKHRREKRCI
jgi:hypothetical protein